MSLPIVLFHKDLEDYRNSILSGTSDGERVRKLQLDKDVRAIIIWPGKIPLGYTAQGKWVMYRDVSGLRIESPVSHNAILSYFNIKPYGKLPLNYDE